MGLVSPKTPGKYFYRSKIPILNCSLVVKGEYLDIGKSQSSPNEGRAKQKIPANRPTLTKVNRRSASEQLKEATQRILQPQLESEEARISTWYKPGEPANRKPGRQPCKVGKQMLGSTRSIHRPSGVHPNRKKESLVLKRIGLRVQLHNPPENTVGRKYSGLYPEESKLYFGSSGDFGGAESFRNSAWSLADNA